MPYLGDAAALETQRRAFFPDDFGSILAERAAIEPGSRVLDAGTGGGFLARSLARALPLAVVGVDLSVRAIAHAEQAARASGHRWHGYLAADATRLPFQDRAFDVAACLTLLCVLPDPLLALREMRRVARQRVLALEWSGPMDIASPEDPEREALLLARAEAARTGFAKRFGADHYLGARLPALFRDAGLRNVLASGLSFAFSYGDPTRPRAWRLELAKAELAQLARAAPETALAGGFPRESWEKLERSTRARLERFVREPGAMDDDVEWQFVHLALVAGDV